MAKKKSPNKGDRSTKPGATRDDAIESRKRRFLACFVAHMTVSGACRMADLDTGTVYDWLHDDPEFRHRMDKARAEGIERWEAEVARRAFEGVRKLKISNGEPVIDPRVTGPNGGPVYLEEVEYSDTLAQFMLKGAAPEKYRERTEVTHGGQVAVIDEKRKVADALMSDPAALAAIIAAGEAAALAEDAEAESADAEPS